MAEPAQTVFVVDDDDDVRDSVALLLEAAGWQVETFASAQDFLAALQPDRGGCLVLDIRMPGMSGLELQSHLNDLGSILPIIFITGHGDVPAAVQALRSGAVDFLQKPFDDQELLDRIERALEHDVRQRLEQAQSQEIGARLARLTPRERQVLELVVAGLANKNIASHLEVSQRTVEIHRARVMEKMQAESLAHLVRLVLTVEG